MPSQKSCKVPSEYTKPDQTNPMEDRLIKLPMKERRTLSDDPRLLVLRAGWSAHTTPDDDFWFLDKNGEIAKPTYNQGKFCEGFNLTALDFYILNRRLMALLWRDDLWLMNWQSDIKAKFKLAEVKKKVLKHPLFKKNPLKAAIHPFWKDHMLREWMNRTSEWMRENSSFISENAGGRLEKPEMQRWEPKYMTITTTWNWGPAVLALQYGKQSMVPLSKLSVIVRDQLNDWAAKPINMVDFVPVNVKSFRITDLSFDLLWARIKKELDIDDDDSSSILSYAHPYWGNEVLRIQDDRTLHVAVNALRVRGCNSITFLVVADPEAEYEEEDMDVDMEEHSDENDEVGSAGEESDISLGGF
jgi:hypothetical protein